MILTHPESSFILRYISIVFRYQITLIYHLAIDILENKNVLNLVKYRIVLGAYNILCLSGILYD